MNQLVSSETEPLLGSGDAQSASSQRLGGRNTGKSKLVEPEIQETGEPTNWVKPSYEPKSMMKQVSDTFHHLRQQITGRNTIPQHGTYARIPTEEEAVAGLKITRAANEIYCKININLINH